MQKRTGLRPWMRGFSWVMILLTLTSCALPGRKPAATPLPEPTLPTSSPAPLAVKALQNETLPPVLVETEPLEGSRISPRQPVTFLFSQAMEPASTEAALSGTPPLSGKFSWLDDATLRFTPDQALPLDTAQVYTFAPTARAKNGTLLPRTAAVTFQVAAPMQVVQRLPLPESTEVTPFADLAVTFSEPVIALGAPPSSLPDAFTVEPPVKGRGEWLNTSTYVFHPATSLAGGQRYTVRIDPGLKSAFGTSLAEDADLEWSFSTSLPRVVGFSSGTGERIALDQELQITFNQRMDSASVAANTTLRDATAREVPLSFVWDEEYTLLTLSPRRLLARDTAYHLEINPAALSAGGTPLADPYIRDLFTLSPLQLTASEPPQSETFYSMFGYGSFTLVFNTPLDHEQDFASLITIDPEPSWVEYFTFSSERLYVSGGFNPSTAYSIHVDGALSDIWGGEMGRPLDLVLVSNPLSPTIQVASAMMLGPFLSVLPGQTVLPGQIANINTLNFETAAIDPVTAIALAEYTLSPEQQQPPATSVWTLFVSPDPDRLVPSDLPLTPDGSAPPTGLYVYRVSSPQLEYSGQQILLVNSRVNLLLKVGEREVTVWAVDLETTQPLSGLAVQFLTPRGDPAGTCTTSGEGLCSITYTREDPWGTQIYAVAGNPGDPLFAFASAGMSAGVQNWKHWRSQPGQYRDVQTYLYTDRPVYCPGQQVFFNLILRNVHNSRYALSAQKDIELTVLPPFNERLGVESDPLTTLRLSLDEYGTAHGSFTLPENSPAGMYSFVFPELQKLYAGSFQVAEYRKADFELKVTFDREGYLPGQDLTAVVESAYYFGVPAGNLRVNWTLARNPSIQFPGDGWQVGGSSRGGPPFGMFLNDEYSYLIARGEGTTSSEGKLTIRIPAADLADIPRELTQTLTLEVSAADLSDQSITARTTATFHPAAYYILAKPARWQVRAKTAVTFLLETVDWDFKASGNRALTAQFDRITWERSTRPNAAGDPTYEKISDPVGNASLRSDGLGKAEVRFTPPQPGTYELTLSGEGGALTSLFIWVGGEEAVLWPELTNQELPLKSDAVGYKPGDTALLRLTNPFAGTSLALVTLERGEVMQSMVVPLQGPLPEVRIPITEDFAPNVFASVFLIGQEPGGRTDYRHGTLELPVTADHLRLQVTAEADTTHTAPGQPVKIEVKITDAGAQPVEGQFSIALVDQALLALSESGTLPIFEQFYGPQGLSVLTGANLTVSSLREVPPAPGRGGGGSGAPAPEAPALRSDFRDTAFWLPDVRTDAQGSAIVEVKLPDNLTTWVGDLRVIDRESRVGSTALEITTSRPLMLRPVLPAFFTAGDRVQLGAVLHNTTAQALTGTVDLQAGGLTLDASTPAVQTIEVPAAGEMRVNWWVTVSDTASIDPLFRVEAGGFTDQTRAEYGPIPVLRQAVPYTFATAGMLAEEGDLTEIIALPRSFTPSGGNLRIELTPSLAAVLLDSLKITPPASEDLTETIISRLFGNLAVQRAVTSLGLTTPAQGQVLRTEITALLTRLAERQNPDGGFSFSLREEKSQPFLSAYALLALTQAREAGFPLAGEPEIALLNYLYTTYPPANEQTSAADLDLLAFLNFAALSAENTPSSSSEYALGGLIAQRDRLSPWARALLLRSLHHTAREPEMVTTLASELASTALRSASGASWEAPESRGCCWATPGCCWATPGCCWASPVFTTAVVVTALAQVDPAQPLLIDAVRYIVLNRQAGAQWRSDYETAWAILALSEALTATGDLQADYTFEAQVNGSVMVKGTPPESGAALQTLTAEVPLSSLAAQGGNELVIRRGSGTGRLYYRAWLTVHKPAADIVPLDRGLRLYREYFSADTDCVRADCEPLHAAGLSAQTPVVVRLTLTVPHDLYAVEIEDHFPAGMQAVDPSLLTSRRLVTVPAEAEEDPLHLFQPFNPGMPFAFGWWHFSPARLSSQGIQWTAERLPAGTYQLSYRLIPQWAGEFAVLPARAWEHYFPEVYGSSAGDRFTINP